MTNPFPGPMQPRPGLEPLAHRIFLPKANLTTFFYETGEGHPQTLLLIHGLGDEADTWHSLLPPLSTQYHVIAPDLPGFGRSDKPDIHYTPAFFQDWLLELLDSLNFYKATLVGHSLGSVIVQSFALRFPERVERLVLLSGSLVADTKKVDLHTLLFIVPVLGEWLYNRLRKNPQEAYRSLVPYYSNLKALPQTERDFLFQRVNERVWDNAQRRAFLSTLRSLVRWIPGQQKNMASRLKGLPFPTTVIWGELDRVNPVDSGRALAQIAPAIQLHVIPGAGHNLQQEAPDLVAAQLLAARIATV